VVDISKQTGDLDNLIRANMEDGKSKMAQSIFYIRQTQEIQQIIRENLGDVAYRIEAIEDRYKGKELTDRIKQIFKDVYKGKVKGIGEMATR